MRYKKLLAVGLVALMGAFALTGCGGSGSNSNSLADSGSSSSSGGDITVCSREDGSGTRGAFTELFGIEEKQSDGTKVDKTIQTAEITNSTAVMMQTVADNKSAIGYISLGSLDDSVKALKVDGAEASVENVKSGSYKVARPFNILKKGELSGMAADFEKFIMSSDGQKIVEDNGYVPVDAADAYTASGQKGEITVAGSSSVSPVMEKLAEAYEKLNSGAKVTVETSDSTTGVTSTQQGICDIGMASRELSDDEKSSGVEAEVIAQDGIAIVVNKDNKAEDISSDQVKDIYTGKITSWDDLSK